MTPVRLEPLLVGNSGLVWDKNKNLMYWAYWPILFLVLRSKRLYKQYLAERKLVDVCVWQGDSVDFCGPPPEWHTNN